jgi:hypothetical protein
MNDPYKWLTDFLDVRNRTSPLSLRYIIPDLFERYFFIHNNYGILDEYPFGDAPEGSSEQEQENRYQLQRQHVLLLRNSRNAESLYRPISLKELAVRFNTDYSVDMLDFIKEGLPGLLMLSNRTLDNIEKFIELVQKQEPLFMYIDDYYRFQFGKLDEEEEYIKTKGRIEIINVNVYIEFQKKSGFDSCSYLFRKGHPWCLATFEDFPHFILGCDNETSEKLALVDGLEYFETTIDYRLLSGVFKDL